MRKIFIMAICMLLLSCGISAFAAKDAVKVGAALNLTGPMSSWGQLHLQGQQDYFKYVNEVKDGIGGRQLKLIKVDTAYQIPKAISAVKRFCTRGKVDMIATWSTGEGLAVKPIVRKYKTPSINYSTGQDLLNPPIDYMYLPFGSYILDSYAVMQYIKKIHKG
ncbi:MAG TPA: ABC transporter substrate-binding protein, partial [Desulfohalobiaceae bacterium]|nr:ABC transporter substrate-binding protein [Desulfohalobiaceae bacterium]